MTVSGGRQCWKIKTRIFCEEGETAPADNNFSIQTANFETRIIETRITSLEFLNFMSPDLKI